MDTTNPIVPSSPASQTGGSPAPEDQPAPPVTPRWRRHGRWFYATIISGATLIIAGIGALFIHVPYATIEPGSARPVSRLISVSGHDVYPPKGEVLFTTVGVSDNVSLMKALVGWLDPHTDVIAETTLRGNAPPAQYQQQNVEAMSDSKTTAEELVLRHLGYTDLGAGALIHDVQSDVPAASVLKADDLVVAIDGKPVSTSSEAADAIHAHQPNDTITLSVVRDKGGPQDITTTLAKGDQGQALLGVRMTTDIKMPFTISINSGNVEGPSAGLAYALALLDDLTPGELTGGQKVAVTGELAPDGSVTAIGGVTQKVEAVKRSGTKIFLVPKDNYNEAKKAAGGGLQVRSVTSFDDALTVLGNLDGSNALALAQPGGPPHS